MPLLDDAKNCFVGQTQIKQIFAGTQKVWPKSKSCGYDEGRPAPLPPVNNGPGLVCTNRYYFEFGSIAVQWSVWGNDEIYTGYQCDLFDTEICEWVKQGITVLNSRQFNIDPAYIKDFQTYDARVTRVFKSTGLPDETMWRYANNTDGSSSFVTVPSRAPTAPDMVNVYPNYPGPGSIRLNWNASVPPETTQGDVYGIEGYRIEIKLASSSTWELFRETTGPSYSYEFTEADGLVLGTRYVFRVAGITTICLSQSGFTESDPFLFT